MTTLIDRLAMRALGAMPVVTPVPRPRFAATPTLASDRGGHGGDRVVALVQPPRADTQSGPPPTPPTAARAR